MRILVQRLNWVIFLRKGVRRGQYSQWRSLSCHIERISVHKSRREGNIWFQQIAPRATRLKLHSVLRPVFENRIISRRADVVWPPLDYYLWGAVKDKCYTDNPETIDALKDNIHEAIGEIQQHTIDNVLRNWTDRVG